MPDVPLCAGQLNISINFRASCKLRCALLLTVCDNVAFIKCLCVEKVVSEVSSRGGAGCMMIISIKPEHKT